MGVDGESDGESDGLSCRGWIGDDGTRLEVYILVIVNFRN